MTLLAMDSRVSGILISLILTCGLTHLIPVSDPKMQKQVATTTSVIGTAVIATLIAGYLLYRRQRNRIPTLLNSDSTIKHMVPLIDKIPISPDTYNFRFGLPSPDHVLGLPIGQHVIIFANVGDERVMRKYTPVTSDEDKGHFDLVIKVYKSGVNPLFPDGGKMTQHVDNMNIGDVIPVAGPVGRMWYHGKGRVTMMPKRPKGPKGPGRRGDHKPPGERGPAAPPPGPEKRQGTYKKMGMIAGGSGIAPMLQLIEAVIRDPDDKSQMSLLFANQSEKDILLRDRLDVLVKENPDRLKVWYTVDRVEEGDGWQYSTGFVDADMIEQHLPPPADDTLILICGPPAMIRMACNPNLDKLGYQPQHRFLY